MTVIDLPGRSRPGIFSRLRAWFGPRPAGQFLLVAASVGLIWWFGTNTLATMDRIGIDPGFDFLWRRANFAIGEGVIPFLPGDTYAWAILVGILNTIKAALLGCVIATVLGVALGVARLSGNLLLANLVRWYVEVIRNTPLLLQLFFWSALTHAFPAPRQALSALGSVYLSNRGVFVPGVTVSAPPLAGWLLVAFVVGLIASLWIARKRRVRFWPAAGAAAAVTAVAIAAFVLAGGSAGLDVPVLAGFNIRGGWSLTPEFAALLVGLVVKFSASIAEIVRAGIESVDRGQWEAARALGLHDAQIMRTIVLPQALRVIVPLLTSSYLDLTKDSSLAVAIGYPDLVNVINTTANTTGQSLEALAILVVVYLTLNLSVSALMNLYNRRVALRGDRAR